MEYAVRGSSVVRSARQWPPENVAYKDFYLSSTKSGSVHSLNDGSLTVAPPAEEAATSYSYPNPGWVSGVVGFGPNGPAGGFDPARRVLTFTGAALETDLEIAGPIRLSLFASSSLSDTDFFIKVCDQFPQDAQGLDHGVNPSSEVVSRGWLKASHRALDPGRSTPEVPCHPHDQEEPLTPGVVYQFEISVEPQAYLFRAGHRIRLEIVNGDSPVTEVLWPHYYRPGKIGTDTIHHGPAHLSKLILPVTEF